jgi:ABC-type sugar transport system ATPase subunit
MGSGNILEMNKVVKQFPGVLALDAVDLEIKKGEVLAVIGENGAGKSTLMKILAGAYRMDSGEIILDGKEVPPDTIPKERMDLGISTIYQELNYLNEMTIAENLFIGRVPVRGLMNRVDYQKMQKDSEELLCYFNLDYHPFTMVKDLTVADKQVVEILRAVSRDVKILIMDEPTSSLNKVETERLFEFIRELKKKGVSIIYISHKLDEVFTIADRVQVMRDGKRVGVLDVGEATSSELVELMVGRSIVEMYPKEDTQIGDEVLRVENLSCNIAEDISFYVRRGEILGLFGLVGSGCVEAVEGVMGIRAVRSGKFHLDGKEATIDNPLEAKSRGIGYIPSDRKQEGLVLMQSVKDNLTITKLDELGPGLVMDMAKEREYCDLWIKKMGVKTPSRNAVIDSLSGGNQQKVVIAKWLLTNPKVLIMNDPTRGIDVGAKVEIYKVMEELCREGISIIMVSSELPEIMGITDRMMVLAEGRVVGEFARSEYDQNKILHLAVKGSENEQENTCAD